VCHIREAVSKPCSTDKNDRIMHFQRILRSVLKCDENALQKRVVWKGIYLLKSKFCGFVSYYLV